MKIDKDKIYTLITVNYPRSTQGQPDDKIVIREVELQACGKKTITAYGNRFTIVEDAMLDGKCLRKSCPYIKGYVYYLVLDDSCMEELKVHIKSTWKEQAEIVKKNALKFIEKLDEITSSGLSVYHM